MGVSMHTYVGPYVECHTSEVEVDAKMRACTRGPTCSQHEREVHDRQRKFCPQCGSPIGEVTYKTKQKNVVANWLREEINEDLSNVSNDTFFNQRSRDNGIDTWIANKKFTGRNCWLDEASYVGEITIDNIVRETEEFRVKFADALRVFREKYGDGKCIVKWGIVHYWS
jgi:hypothetical protein